MNVKALLVMKRALKYVGAVQYGSAHKGLIDRYNKVLPRPSGYQMTYDDAWCDAFVTAIADEAGVSHLIGRECGVERHIKVFRSLGIWLGRVQPVVGDLVTFDWDGGGFADHIGYVAEVVGNRFRTVEGNSNGRVEQNWFSSTDWRVKGFARPKYGEYSDRDEVSNGSSDITDGKSVEVIAGEVLLGVWGNNPERTRGLVAAGYDALAVQKRVNELMNGRLVNDGSGVLAKRVSVLPEAMTYYTGEMIDAWVKGSEFEVLAQKSVVDLVGVKQVVYLMGYQGGVIGWVRAGDVKLL